MNKYIKQNYIKQLESSETFKLKKKSQEIRMIYDREQN